MSTLVYFWGFGIHIYSNYWRCKGYQTFRVTLIAESLYSIVSGCGWRLGVINERPKYFKGALDGCKLWHISNVCSKKCNFLYQGLISLEKVFRELSLVEEDTQSWL